jgi:hypothetical protein
VDEPISPDELDALLAELEAEQGPLLPTCRVCGRECAGLLGAKYCGSTCRSRAWRARRPRWKPVCEECLRIFAERVDTRHCSAA